MAHHWVLQHFQRDFYRKTDHILQKTQESAGSSCTCQAQTRHAWWWTTWGDTTVRQSKMQNLQNDYPTQIAKSASGAIIKLRCNTSCKTTNVVYLITCTKCGKQYVGETGDHAIHVRVNIYMSSWEKSCYSIYEKQRSRMNLCSSFTYALGQGETSAKN